MLLLRFSVIKYEALRILLNAHNQNPETSVHVLCHMCIFRERVSSLLFLPSLTLFLNYRLLL